MLPKSHVLQQQVPFSLQFHVRPPSHPPSLPIPSFFLTHLLSSYVELFYLILLVSHLPYFPIFVLYPYIPHLICLIFLSLISILIFFATFTLFSYPYLVSLYSLYHHLSIYYYKLTILSNSNASMRASGKPAMPVVLSLDRALTSSFTLCKDKQLVCICSTGLI